MNNPKPMLIGVVCNGDDTVVAWIAVSAGDCMSTSKKRREGYIYGVMETLFNVHPLFASSTCCWRESEASDIQTWMDSSLPAIIIW